MSIFEAVLLLQVLFRGDDVMPNELDMGEKLNTYVCFDIM